MKRAAPDAARVDGDELFDAREHLARRFVREREQQDVGRVDAVFDEPRHAIGERACLAAACAGDNEHRSFARHHDFELLGVQLFFIANAVLLLRFRGSFEGVAADFGHGCTQHAA